MQRKTRLSKIHMTAIVLLALVLYALFVEPYWIEVTHHVIAAPVARPVKIMQLSDLHVRAFGRRELRVIEMIEVEKPDIILVTGDFVSDTGDDSAVIQLFSKIEAPLGVWVVRGNWDYWKGKEVEVRLRELQNIKFLVNQNARVREDLWVIGLDDAFEGKPDRTVAFEGVPENVARLLLFHSPSFFPLVEEPFSIAFAGHTHGGQFRIPFIGALWLPPFSGDYSDGWYNNEGKQLYVSRGIGNSLVDARFNCRPEVAIFDLTPASPSK